MLRIERPHGTREGIDDQPADQPAEDDVADVPSIDPAIHFYSGGVIAILRKRNGIFLSIKVTSTGIERDACRGSAPIDLDAALVGDGDLRRRRIAADRDRSFAAAPSVDPRGGFPLGVGMSAQRCPAPRSAPSLPGTPAAEIADKVGAMTPSDTSIRRPATLMLVLRARKEP